MFSLLQTFAFLFISQSRRFSCSCLLEVSLAAVTRWCQLYKRGVPLFSFSCSDLALSRTLSALAQSKRCISTESWESRVAAFSLTANRSIGINQGIVRGLDLPCMWVYEHKGDLLFYQHFQGSLRYVEDHQFYFGIVSSLSRRRFVLYQICQKLNFFLTKHRDLL